MSRRVATVALTLVVVLGLALPAAAVVGDGPERNAVGQDDVSAGHQLATVLSVTSADVTSEVDEAGFEAEYERGNDTARAEAIADRAAALDERSEALLSEYESLTEARRAGDISETIYAQRLAVLSARADNVARAYDRLDQRAASVSSLELRVAGVSRADLRDRADALDSVRGAGTAALLERFTGVRDGEVRIDVADGVRIEVESDDGEFSRELERPRDDDENISVEQATALTTARGALSTQNEGRWELTRTSIDHESGYYEFEFRLAGSNATVGETEVRVDGSSGDVFRVKEEIEPREDDDGEDDRDDGSDDSEDELSLVVVDGTVAPGETVTVQALDRGTPRGGVTIAMNDRIVGETDEDGFLELTLPDGGEVELAAETDDDDAELGFELGDDFAHDVRANGTLANGSAAVSVTVGDEPLADASVFVDGVLVGTTDEDGTTTFDTDATEDVELTVQKGELAVELELVADGENLTLVDAEVDDFDEEREDETEDERDDDGTEDERDDDEMEDERDDDEMEDERDDDEMEDERDDDEMEDERDDDGTEEDGDECDADDTEEDGDECDVDGTGDSDDSDDETERDDDSDADA
jgi:hypothetical protein